MSKCRPKTSYYISCMKQNILYLLVYLDYSHIGFWHLGFQHHSKIHYTIAILDWKSLEDNFHHFSNKHIHECFLFQWSYQSPNQLHPTIYFCPDSCTIPFHLSSPLVWHSIHKYYHKCIPDLYCHKRLESNHSILKKIQLMQKVQYFRTIS